MKKSIFTFPNDTKKKILESINLGTVLTRPLEWIWKNRIPRGKLTIFVGNPGVGKSWLSLYIAARVTKGEFFPDCPDSVVEKGRVLILNDEDGLGDTIRPRIEACGGDLLLIDAVTGTINANGSKSFFNLSCDLEALKEKIIKFGDVKLIIFDPIKAYIGRRYFTDGNSDQDVRAVLTPLCALAEEFDISIIGIMHFSK